MRRILALHLTIVRAFGKEYFAYSADVPLSEDKITAFGRALAAVISERRGELDMSLTQLGTKAGLSQQSVSYLERLKRTPSIETLLRVAHALEVSVSSLIRKAEQRAEREDAP